LSEQVRWDAERLLTDSVIEKHRQRVGMKMRPDNTRNEYADPDNTRVFANAIGDSNPIWRDAEYAAKTRYRKPVAHPAYLNVMSSGEVVQGMPGITSFHMGTRWEFYRPICVGDRFELDCTFADLEEKKGGLAARWLMEYYETLYRNQLGELVARSIGTMARADRQGMKKDSTKKERQRSGIVVPHPWTDEERERLENEMVTSDHIRGSETRYWDDVSVGEELPELAIGPLRIGDILAWLCAESLRVTMSTHIAIRMIRKQPALAMLHPDSNAREWVTMVHWDNKAAQANGLPGAYDIGGMRQSYAMRHMTNWMGDDGFLKLSDCRYRRFVFIGDSLRLGGTVVDRYADKEGVHCVDIRTRCINQREEDVMPGLATVALPARNENMWPIDMVARH